MSDEDATERWLIWGCCAHCAEEDSLDDALSYAHSLSEGDWHVLHGIECPDGRLIDAESREFHDYSTRRKVEEKQRREQWATEHPKPERIGVLCIRSPYVKKAWDRESYTDQDRLAEDTAAAVRRYGADRVRVLTGPDMDDWKKP